MEAVYETEQPLEAVVEGSEDAKVEENAETYQELLDALQLLLQDGNNAETVEETVVESSESSESVDITESDGQSIAGLFVLGMIAGILLVRALLERFYV